MGLLETFIQSLKDLNPEWTPDRVKTAGGLLADFTPVVGDVKAGYDMVDSVRQGNYGEAALNGLGLLPFVPSLGMPIYPAAKARFINDLKAGEAVTPYALGYVTDGQKKALNKNLGSKVQGNDVMIDDNTLRHIIETRIIGDGYSPEEVARFAEQSLLKSSHVLGDAKGAKLTSTNHLDTKTGKRYDAVMPVRARDGFFTVTVVPDRLRAR